VNKNRRIALPTFEGFIFINVRDIMHCKSESNYTTIHLANGDQIVVTRTLKEIEESVNSPDFFRVHKSYIINLKCITRYIKGEGGIVILKDGSEVEVSRRNKLEFLKRITARLE